ncbi:Dienelactone hydrolase family protein [Fodinibius roseus]|uniref:Dienelactone hydrolase family protein n=1 Tax=Fodinibius roseus TaxID=1194090 RepID=A0A1M5DQE1_9BACT|nr:alpha/beta hydrolase family protein [Fodinibius roseus]SHF69207.1 Dienelactone hydrolase family protein [Fodinibius roseus]
MDRRNFIKSSAFFGTALGFPGSISLLQQSMRNDGIDDDLASIMVEGVHRFLDSEIQSFKKRRDRFWKYDFSSNMKFNESIASQREELAYQLGVVDDRVSPVNMETLTGNHLRRFIIDTEQCTIRAVRWQVLGGIYNDLWAEGLYLKPQEEIQGRIILLPDADIIPEVAAGIQGSNKPGFGMANLLAENGFEVLIPALVNRNDTFSGNKQLDRYTNQPHREWIYRQGFVLGRHIIGYELQKIFAAVDWFRSLAKTDGSRGSVGVAGYGEGGMLALLASALDTRITSTLVSGYFDSREDVWREPIYRNVFGMLKQFGDAELASMSWPRKLIIEHAEFPEVTGPPPVSEGRSGAAPGRITTPSLTRAKAEWERAVEKIPKEQNHLQWYDDEGAALKTPFSRNAVSALASGLEVQLSGEIDLSRRVLEVEKWIDAKKRQERTIRDIESHIQQVLRMSEKTRKKKFWDTLKEDKTSGNTECDSDGLKPIKEFHRNRLWDVIGRLPSPSVPANPRVEVMEKGKKWTSYNVRLDVWPEVEVSGILLVPTDVKEGVQRPVVVCQHGLEGRPEDVITKEPGTRAYEVYEGFASTLAEKGYVTFAPQGLFRGEENFRLIQRKANPLGLSLYSFMVGQHQRIVEWLGEQSYIDSERIGFYGLSYGGKTAMRVPALVEEYALSICSGDFNEWVRKVANAGPDAYNSYPFTKEYEIPEWDLGHTYNYAEMAALIAPRPFMVERGHFDGVGKDEWVAYEFAKVRRHYDLLDLSEAARIEYFNGPHKIHGKGTFEFIDQHL